MLLGVIADDLTGATDVALMLSREGMKTVQLIGAPSNEIDLEGADAVVVALKSRTIPAPEAVALLLANGFSRFVVAGGETSGAVVGALGVSALQIGPEIDPGVPWTRSIGAQDVALALKSGNFGTPDFFLKAWTKSV